MKRLLVFVIPVLALGAGAAAGAFLHTPATSAVDGAGKSGSGETGAGGGEAPEYVKLSNQFVVPILSGGDVVSLVILSLSLEVPQGQGEVVYDREPKLRDAFLQVLFDHANAGGFAGDFTSNSALAPLRQALREAAFAVLGDRVSDVLISDIVRQDS